MYSLNRASLIGNLTRDPETRSIPSGQSVCQFAVATNRRWKDADGNVKEDTQYHEVVVWGRLGELAATMLVKGKKVYIEGRLQTRSWEAQDGSKRNRTEIVAENFIPLSPKGDGQFSTQSYPDSTEKTDPTPSDDLLTDQVKTDKKSTGKSVGPTVSTDPTEINLDDIPF
ncbi:MAG: single-stranded DNA-binding protein [Patescibacteria group bacterium]